MDTLVAFPSRLTFKTFVLAVLLGALVISNLSALQIAWALGEFELGNLSFDAGDFEGATRAWLCSVNDCPKLEQQIYTNLIHSLPNCVEKLRAAGQPAEAEQLLEQAYIHSDIEAYLCYQFKRYSQAEGFFKQSINLQIQCFHGDKSVPRLGQTELATLYLAEGKYELAETLCEEVLGIKGKPKADRLETFVESGRPHMGDLVVAAAMVDLAKVYCTERRYDDAGLLYREALRITERYKDGSLQPVWFIPSTDSIKNNLLAMHSAHD